MIRRGTGMAACVLMAVGLAALPSAARVFRQAGSGSGNKPFDVSALGRVLYEAEVRVDGRPAHVSVLNAPGSPEEWGSRIRAFAGGRSLRYASGSSIGFADLREGGHTLRMLKLPAGKEGVAVAISTRATAGKPDRDEGGLAEGLPVYREATIRRVMRNEDTRTTMQISGTTDSPAAALAFYRAALARDGWRPVAPLPRGTAGAGLAGFSRGADLCWILCRRAESGGETRITLLHKRGGMNSSTGDR